MPGARALTRTPCGSELDRESARHLDNAGLGRGVDALPRLDIDRADRRYQDDAAALVLDHDARRGARDAKRSFEVELDDAIEFLVGVVEQPLAQIDRRGGEHHIQATEIALNPADQRFHTVPYCARPTVACVALPPALQIRLRHAGRVGGIDVGADNVRADAAIASALAWPMPEPPPTTSAARPERSKQ